MDHTFRISKEKNIERMLSRVLNPLLQNHVLARVVDYFIVGHILRGLKLLNWVSSNVEAVKI